MPFIDKQSRFNIATGVRLPETPGELCYMEYVRILKEWRESPRWKTVDRLFREVVPGGDVDTAQRLAFMVFFVKHVMPYEEQKAKENGDI